MPHLSILINPKSGGYSCRKLEYVIRMFKSEGIIPDIYFTNTPTEMTNIVRRLCIEQQNPIFVIFGGDGTFNTVLNGITNNSATLAILPLGTANVLCYELGITSLAEAVRRVIFGTSRPFSVGNLKNGHSERKFMLMAGIGVDGFVVNGVSNTSKRLLGKGAYFIAILRHLFSWNKEELKVTIDNTEYSCHSLIVCNASHYAGNAILSSNSSLFSPYLDLIGIRTVQRLGYVRLLLQLLCFPKLPDSSLIWKTRGKVLNVEGNKAIQVDGDSAGDSPATLEVISSFARLIV